jgi:hypothetical protein
MVRATSPFWIRFVHMPSSVVDPDPEAVNKFHLLKYWMFSFEDGRLPL